MCIRDRADSLAFINAFNKIAKEKGLSSAEDLKPYFFADTYQFFWTVKPEEFFGKFEKDYQEFWTADRIAKEKKLGPVSYTHLDVYKRQQRKRLYYNT